MEVFLLDGTYELFRHYFGAPPHRDADGNDRAAVVGVLGSVVRLFEEGATHIGVATDHVVESFRNDLWPGYKSSAGMEEGILSQFLPLEDSLTALGVRVWPMDDLEADDALASAAIQAAEDPEVTRVVIATPDKDLGQCVGGKVVQFDRQRREMRDAAAVEERFGVPPVSIPDYLALTGDSADGFPGLKGWGAKSSSTVLARYGHIEAIPLDPSEWDVTVRGAARLATALADGYDEAMLFRDLATLRTSAPVFESVEELRWTGPTPEFEALAEHLRSPGLLTRALAAAP
ncbi:MAG: flap endonuclease [Chloroflexi bacterium]|nr:flap endonuclease [Chloroflexota bacterium]MYD65692.1 flap endonuclease [Chloroflexota bacterium]